jgi:hypothetical protein
MANQEYWGNKFELGNGPHLWYNPINKTSLRLTRLAWSVLIDRDIKFYRFDLEKTILPKVLLQLERCFTEPYYIQSTTRIHLMSDRDAMMLTLHANNLEQYLDNLSQ